LEICGVGSILDCNRFFEVCAVNIPSLKTENRDKLGFCSYPLFFIKGGMRRLRQFLRSESVALKRCLPQGDMALQRQVQGRKEMRDSTFEH
jgi:hypothetical protein